VLFAGAADAARSDYVVFAQCAEHAAAVVPAVAFPFVCVKLAVWRADALPLALGAKVWLLSTGAEAAWLSFLRLFQHCVYLLHFNLSCLTT
jgi:hypothetical protein